MLLIIVASDSAQAAWPQSPFQWVSIGPVPSGRVGFPGSLYITKPIDADGHGGLIAAWPPQGLSLVAQRVDSAAALLWNGDAIADGPRYQLYPVVVADGSGGAFVVWADWRSATGPDIYAQRIHANGSMLWDPRGVAVCTADQPQGYITAASDGQGGLLVAWQDNRAQWQGSSSDVYAQRLTGAGVPLWDLDGRGIATGSGSQDLAKLLPTGDGGVYVAWTASSALIDRIWIQKLNPNGMPGWSAPTHVTNSRGGPLASLVTDGAGGVYVGSAFAEVQRVTAAGVLPWGPQGVPLSDQPSYLQSGVADESGGAYWLFTIGARSYRMTRTDSGGAHKWQSPITIGTGAIEEAVFVADGSGGAITSWIDSRSGAPLVYASRLDSVGQESWEPGGLAVSVEPGAKHLLGGVTDGAHGVIVAWDDHDAREIRAQRVDAAGSILPYVAENPRTITLAPTIPNPSKAGILIRFSIPTRAHTRVSVFDIGGRLVQRVHDGELPAGAHQFYWTGYGSDYRRVGSGVYQVLLEALGERASTRAVLVGGPMFQPGRPE